MFATGLTIVRGVRHVKGVDGSGVRPTGRPPRAVRPLTVPAMDDRTSGLSVAPKES